MKVFTTVGSFIARVCSNPKESKVMQFFHTMLLEVLKIVKVIPAFVYNNESKKLINSIRIPLSFVFGMLLLFIFIPLPLGNLNANKGTVIADENGNLLRMFLSDNDMWNYPSDKSIIPGKVKQCVLEYEDRFFYYHPGINPKSLIRAFIKNIKGKKIVQGGSTITMQLTRVIHPKKRTYANKLLELFQTLKLEILFSKNQILGLYLDNTPYGGNIIGYRSASLRYFGKLPEYLSWAEAATLAVIPNNPNKFKPGKNIDLLTQKRNMLLTRIFNRKLIDKDTYKLALTEPVHLELMEFSTIAPHFSNFVYFSEGKKKGIISTSLSSDLQKKLEQIIRDYSLQMKMVGVRNCAALLVDNEFGNIKAYAGSQGFWDPHDGQVDGVTALRSPGSTLKPFLYALAIDEGLALPQTLIHDIPSYYGSFSPSNSDKKFRGLIRMQDSLIQSLNIPAIRMLNSYGVESFYLFLKRAGIKSLFRLPEDYGLSLILGGMEVSMLDMATLYKGLANYGKFSPVSYKNKESIGKINSKDITKNILSSSIVKNEKVQQLISPESAYLILEVLKDLKRPGSEYYWNLFNSSKLIAWKTGTSYGFKDAWAVGITPKWTIIVWIGNFDAEPNPALAGIATAAPLLFSVLGSLPENTLKYWFKEPLIESRKIPICSETGFLATKICPNTVLVSVPSSMKSLGLCPYHKEIFVSSNEKFQVCSYCWDANNYRKITKLSFSPDIVQYMIENGYYFDPIPLHNPNCPNIAIHSQMKIVYPQNGMKIWIPRDFGNALQKIALKAAHNDSTLSIYWYIDGKYIEMTQGKHTIFVNLEMGWHELTIIDSNGQTMHVQFYTAISEMD